MVQYTKDGERLTRTMLSEVHGNISEYIDETVSAMRIYQKKQRRPSALLGITHCTSIGRGYCGKAYFPRTSRSEGTVLPTELDFRVANIHSAFRQVSLNPLFARIKRLEETFGPPQYIEWAMTIHNEEPKFWITQIADVQPKLDIMDFCNNGTILFMCHTVTGAGTKEGMYIANCWNPSDIETLREFNNHNTGYVLLYSSRLTTAGASGIRKLTYADFSNAAVFLEIQDSCHVGDPVAHLRGQLDMTGKLFGVLDYDAEVRPQWDSFDARQKTEFGIKVYDGRFKIIASERQNRLVVYATD